MNQQEAHIPDGELLRHLDGELSAGETKAVLTHLAGCWQCRARCQWMEQAIADFVNVYHGSLDEQLPPADGPRALLKARMAEMVSSQASIDRHLQLKIWAATLVVIGLGFVLAQSITRHLGAVRAHNAVVTLPDSRLTPGATLLLSRSAICSQSVANNKSVPAGLQRAVFKEYGISGADPRAYEVDYLITPALGGADDIRNLWPHTYSSAVWNARVKDALESRMRDMVCNGNLELSDAQREIAENWIAAYKKYFHTDRPLDDQ